MFKLRVIQAEFGDCLILETGTEEAPRYILIDGGPETIFDRHLEGELRAIAAAGGKLDAVILSHVDNDHIIGLLDFMAKLREQQANGEAPLIAVDEIWHNSFSRTIGNGNDIETRVRTLLNSAGAAARTMASTEMAVQGISEGNSLRKTAALLGIPLNQRFAGDLICVDDQPTPIEIDNLGLRVVGPTRANLDELRKKWQEWLDAHEDAVASADPLLASMSDRSVPNLSSIMLLAEADGKSILLTGDGRGDHLLQGLKQAGLLDAEGRIHVDVLKVAHHGSDRNTTRKFFTQVTADTYVISANGKHGNPDTATLIWLVEAARDQGRKIEIVVTNETSSSRHLLEEYDPAEYGYALTVLETGKHSLTVDLSP